MSDDNENFTRVMSNKAASSNQPHASTSGSELIDAKRKILSRKEVGSLKLKSLKRSLKRSFYYMTNAALIGMLFVSTFWFVAINKTLCTPIGCLDDEKFLLIAVGLLGSVLSVNTIRVGWKFFQWNVEKEKAKQIASVEPVVEGFTSLFRHYVTTRAIGIYEVFWSVWGLYTFACYFVSNHPFSMDYPILSPSTVIATLAVISCLHVLLAFLISSHFRIGSVLVDFLSIIAYRSANPMDTQNAVAETLEIAKYYRRERYWWFF